ncbi:HNH endonuclease signature motif containing protein [Streptomyces sp. NPDC057575]|uniref:HNH endonuclease signature motif containing protein n=1 Tax=unclassified Streptomyces TaxID=2593676 RepID=UPI003691E3B2
MKGPCTEEEKQRIARTKTQAALQRWREQGGHPLKVRESRTAINWVLRDRGVSAKACSKCFAIKALTAFSGKKDASDGLCSYCRDCSAATHAKRMASDPEYVDRCRAFGRGYYHANASARRQYAGEYRRRLREANLTKNANRVQNPNVLKTCAGQCGRTLPETSFRLDRGQNDGLRLRCRDCADSSRAARSACTEIYGDPVGQPCYLCMNVFTSRAKVQADHLIPVSAGGPDEASNLWWAHDFCNIRRGARPLTPEEWGRVRSLQRQAATTTLSTVEEMTS